MYVCVCRWCPITKEWAIDMDGIRDESVCNAYVFCDALHPAAATGSW